MTEVRCWRDQAACLEVVSADYDPFFSDAAELQAEAIAICETCPVRDACVTFAVGWPAAPHTVTLVRRAPASLSSCRACLSCGGSSGSPYGHSPVSRVSS